MATDMIARALAAKAIQEAAGSSGKEPLVVTFTITDPTTMTCTADKTYEEVDTAYKQNIPIYGTLAYGIVKMFFLCSSYDKDGDDETLIFFGAGPDMTYWMIAYNKNNYQGEITYEIASAGLNFLFSFRDDPGFDANNIKIFNLPNPTENTDAVTKEYADKILTSGNSVSVVIRSSTPNSSKKFRITVDDAGAITATEVV